MPSIRSFQDLAYVDDPAWPGLQTLLASAGISTKVLPPSETGARNTLLRLQVTAHSTLGALALHTGGILVDHGWLRILGAGCDGLPDLTSINGLSEPGPETRPPGALLVAIDVLGGQFAVNGGALTAKPGEVCYFGPDTLGWSAIGCGHTSFVHWALDGGSTEFYKNLRWPGWEDEVRALPPDQGLAVYPPLWSVEGNSDIAGTSRRPVALTELVAFHLEAAAQW